MKKTKRNKQLLESIFSEEEAKTSRFNAVKDWAAANKYGLGATTGVAGLSLAGWAAMRAKLQRDYNRATGEDEKRAIREKIKRLNKLALLGGLGATALTAGATLGGPAAYAAIKGQQATDVTQQPSDYIGESLKKYNITRKDINEIFKNIEDEGGVLDPNALQQERRIFKRLGPEVTEGLVKEYKQLKKKLSETQTYA